MNLSRRSKFSGQGSSVIKGDVKNYISVDNFCLDLMCRYIVSKNTNIRRGQLINLRNLIYSVDPATYSNDFERGKKLSFIKRGIEARLNSGLTDPEMILREINGSIDLDGPINLENYEELTKTEVSWLGNMVSESLKYSYLYPISDRMIDICTRIKNADYGSKASVVKEFETLITEIQNNFRRSKNEEEQEAIRRAIESDKQRRKN